MPGTASGGSRAHEKRLVELREISVLPGSLKLPAALFILAFAEAVILSALPVVAALLTDRTVQGKLSEILFNAAVGIAGGTVLSIFLGVMRDRIAARFQAAAIGALRQSVYDRLQQLSVPFCVRAAQDELPDEIEAEIVSLGEALHYGIAAGLMPALQGVLYTVAMFWADWHAAIAALFLWPWFLFSPTLVARRLSAARAALSLETPGLRDLLAESLAAQPVIRAFRMEASGSGAFRKAIAAVSRLNARVGLLAAFAERLPETGALLLQLAILLLGLMLLSSKQLGFGAFVALLMLVFLLSHSLSRLARYAPVYRRGRVAFERLESLLDDPAAVLDDEQSTPVPSLEADIAFDDVTVAEPESGGQGRALLANISVRIPQGSMVVFVGESGAGKTTLLNLLLRFQDPTSGSVQIDGVDLRQYTQSSLRQRFGLVPQENFVFNTSLLENLRVGRRDASAEAVADAARKVGLVNCAGIELGLARVILQEPEVLLLDELDALDEPSFCEQLRRLDERRTVIATTNRTAGAARADLICVLHAGRIVEQGTHKSLMEADGYYAHLFYKQSGFRFTGQGAHVEVDPDRLRLVPGLEEISPEALEFLASRCATDLIPAEREITREGETASKVYIIVRGSVETPARALQDGDCVDEGAFVRPSKSVATRARTDCICVSLECAHVEEALKKFEIRD